MATRIMFYLIISCMMLSCARELTHGKISRPFNNEFENSTKKTYQEFENYPLSFRDYYKRERSELDRASDIRNKVIDSLGLLEKSNWLLINQCGTNYTGQYEKTYIILDNKCFIYNLPQVGIEIDLEKYQVLEYNLEFLRTYDNPDLYNIYKRFHEALLTKRIDSNPTVNPLITYYIIYVNNKKVSTFKVSSQDYIIKKWK